MNAISIIIPHLNDRKRLYRCLDHLAGQVDEKVEVIVVDNGSDRDQCPELWRYPWVRVFSQREKGAGMARNLGVSKSSARRIAFLDSDCVPSATWVAQARQACIARQIVGGRVATFDESGPRSTGAQLFERLFAFDNERYVTKLGFSVTANLVTSRAVFDRLGPFLPDVAEDYEWCRRAAQQEVSLSYDSDLLVSHPTRSDWPSLRTKWQRLTRESYAPYQARAAGRLIYVVRAGLTAASIVRDAPKVLISRRIYRWADRLKCLSVLFRLRFGRAVWMGRQAITDRV